VLAAWTALATAGVRMAGAQVTTTPEAPRTQAQCNGQQITEVVVHTLPPTYGGVF
jgi:hypothetical protein